MLHLRLLGALDITGAERRAQSTDALLSQPKRAAVLAYLALGSPESRLHRRDALLTLFWPELDEAHARRALNQALYFLRGCLGSGVIITRGDDEVGVDSALLSCDVVQLRALLAAQQFDEALALYHGALLPAFHAQASNDFDDWLDNQRRTLADAVMQAALTLSARAESDGNIAMAIHWARRACDASPLDETCEQRLLRLLIEDGNNAAARAEYARFAERLRCELDVDPAETTRLLLEAPTRAQPLIPERIAPPRTTPPAAPHRRMRTEHSRFVAGVAMLLVVIVTIAARRLWTGDPLTNGAGLRPTILVADFTGPSSDSGLGDVATQLALSALQDSRASRVVWSGEQTATLQRMKIRPGTPVRDSIARELAVREGYAAVLQGFVRESGGTLLVGVSLVAPSTNHVMFMRTATAPNAGGLTTVLDDLMRATRNRIGDARDSIADTKRLEQVTTASLEALRAFSASRLDTARDHRRRIALLERAVTLDTSFASAYRRLGVELYWDGQRERSSEMLRKALLHAERLSNAERELAEATLYSKGRYYDPVRSLAAFDAVLARDPTNFIALDNKEWLLMELREYNRAARLNNGGHATVKDPGPSVYLNYGMLARASFLAGRPKEGWYALDVGSSRDPGLLMVRARVHLLSGQLDSAVADLQRGLDRSPEVDRPIHELDVSELRASMARRGGHLAVARRFDEERIRNPITKRNARLMALALLPRIREAAWVLHRPDLVRRAIPELRQVVELSHGVDRPVFNLAITYADAGDTRTAAALLRDLEKTIAPGEWREIVARIHHGWAYVALAEDRPTDALRELHMADIGSCSICLLPVMSIAYERAGELDSAIVTGERYLSTIDPVAAVYDGHYRPTLHHRLGRLYLRRGDATNAARHLAAFVDMWRDADPELRPQVDSARRELSVAREHARGVMRAGIGSSQQPATR